ncbi:MAG: right-handed parallel beta-helix repeat-containing protein [Candidatus Eisenbacteria bacterium]
MIGVCLFVAARADGNIIQIPVDQPTIQAGIDLALDGDVVLVESGLYFENLDFHGKAITVASRYLETENPAFIEQTVLDGGGQGAVVTFDDGEGADAVLLGFTVTNGNHDYGGGIACVAASPTLRHLIVSENQATGGAGIHCADHASLLIEEVVIRDNSTTLTGTGGGLRCSGYCSPTLRSVVIENNHAENGGGCYFYFYCDPLLSDVAIRGNVATTTVPSSPSGGGVFCGGQSRPRFERVRITGNTAGSTTNLSGHGGGLFCSGGSQPVIVSSTIAENSATFIGGGVQCLGRAWPRFVNSILWDDSPQEIAFDGSFDADSVSVAFCNVAGGQSGILTQGNGTIFWLEGNISEDPRFVNPGPDEGFHLSPDSPCIDAGTDFLEIDGEVVIDLSLGEYAGDGPDMGAFEFLDPASIPGATGIADGIELFVSPNPSNGPISISYRLDEATRTQLELFSLDGRRLAVLDDGLQAAGEHRVDLTRNRLATGTYFARLRATHDGRTTTGTRRFTIAR